MSELETLNEICLSVYKLLFNDAVNLGEKAKILLISELKEKNLLNKIAMDFASELLQIDIWLSFIGGSAFPDNSKGIIFQDIILLNKEYSNYDEKEKNYYKKGFSDCLHGRDEVEPKKLDSKYYSVWKKGYDNMIEYIKKMKLKNIMNVQ